MSERRDLRLKKEVLTELADGDLELVIGAADTVTLVHTQCNTCSCVTCYSCPPCPTFVC